MNAPAATSSRSARSNRSSTRCCASMRAFPTPTSTRRWTARPGPALKQKLIDVFKTKTREEWCKIMEGTDVCFAPILTMKEAPEHPHMAARKIFVDAPRRHPARAGAAFFAHALGDPRAATADIASLTSEWKAEECILVVVPAHAGVPRPGRQIRGSRLGVRSRVLRMTERPTPRPSPSARRGGSGLPRSIRTAP